MKSGCLGNKLRQLWYLTAPGSKYFSAYCRSCPCFMLICKSVHAAMTKKNAGNTSEPLLRHISIEPQIFCKLNLLFWARWSPEMVIVRTETYKIILLGCHACFVIFSFSFLYVHLGNISPSFRESIRSEDWVKFLPLTTITQERKYWQAPISKF